MRWLPLPAQDKWAGTLQLLRLQIRATAHLATERQGPVAAEGLLTEALHQAGEKWVARSLLSPEPQAPGTDVLADTCLVVLKTLGLPSQVAVSADQVVVTTFFCPFLDDAKRAGEDRPSVCERICGEHRSLFKGISEGLPFYVRYQAPLMMGLGAKACVKELHIRGEPALEEAQVSSPEVARADAGTQNGRGPVGPAA